MFRGKNYTITSKNILAHELIGLKTKVIESTDQSRKGISGKIVDETRNTIVIETRKGLKVLPKEECVFEIDLKDEKVIINGKLIKARPEDRIKNFWRVKNAVQ
ncbi:MAG: ribonuclease P protein subunit [Candidatus Diapherotrites archaeon]|nr:ribonuclease P protein subunit [Candidatus Diapherotrites archaeon]